MYAIHLQENFRLPHVNGGQTCLGSAFATLVLVLSVSVAAQESRIGVGSLPPQVAASQTERPLVIAILDFGNPGIGRQAAERFASSLKAVSGATILDQDQTRVAARGAGYEGSINLSLAEARDLGAALGSEFFMLGDAQTLRRSPSTGPPYFESYASIFAVSARTGRLVRWERPSFQGATSALAEQSLLAALSTFDLSRRFELSLRGAQRDERGERELATDREVPLIAAAPDNEQLAAAEGLRLPRPYRRFVPPYPETAANAEVEATVDVLVDLDANGEVVRTEVARWAGFGLDQATVETVRRLHFFPAQRNGVAVPIRVLLRYNFRKPPK
jgi:TonB family protein